MDSPQQAEFEYGSVPTIMQPGSAIGLAQARAAALEFLASGQKPTCVAWMLIDPPHVEPGPFSWDDVEEADPGEPSTPSWAERERD
jgi:hypothetical protein